MKLIGITSSPKGEKSATLKLAKAFAEGAQRAGADVELVDVCRLKIGYCKACDVCHRSGRCIHKDDFAALRDKLLQADGVMLSSPNYFRTVTAQLKTMLDRMSDMIHLQRFTGKYACSLATAGGPNAAEVTQYLDEVLISLGALVVGNVVASVGGGPQPLAEAEPKARALGEEMVSAISQRRVYPEQQERHRQTDSYFRRLVEFNKDRWPFEYEFWAKVR